MDAIDVFKRAIDQTGRIVSNVQSAQLGDPTPCAEWDVKALLNHTISVVIMFEEAARSVPFNGERFGNDNVGSDAGASYKAAADKLKITLAQPGVADATWTMPFGEVPGAAAIGFATLEVVQHGWDVAKATGQTADFDADVTDVAMGAAKAAPADLVRSPGVFGAEVDCPESAPMSDRLAAFMGREV